MKKVSRQVFVALVALSLVLAMPAFGASHGGPGGGQPTPESDGSCSVVGTAHVGSVAGKRTCSYLAHGPGEFRGQASAGWGIRQWRDGTLVAQTWFDWMPYTGWLNTQDGDVVEVIVAEYCQLYSPGGYHCEGGVYPGFVEAGDTES